MGVPSSVCMQVCESVHTHVQLQPYLSIHLTLKKEKRSGQSWLCPHERCFNLCICSSVKTFVLHLKNSQTSAFDINTQTVRGKVRAVISHLISSHLIEKWTFSIFEQR